MGTEPEGRSKVLLDVLLGGRALDEALGRGGTVEETLVSALWPFDPVLCLGRASAQPLGALRLETSDADWQSSVTRLCDGSNRIALIISSTSGLAWEYRDVLSRKLHAKLVVVMPPELPHQMARTWGESSLATEQLLNRWRDSISGTPLADIPASLLETTVAIRFHQDGSPILLGSNSRSAVVYAVACALPVCQFPNWTRYPNLKEFHSAVLRQFRLCQFARQVTTTVDLERGFSCSRREKSSLARRNSRSAVSNS